MNNAGPLKLSGKVAFMVRSPTYREIGVKIETTVSWKTIKSKRLSLRLFLFLFQIRIKPQQTS